MTIKLNCFQNRSLFPLVCACGSSHDASIKLTSARGHIQKCQSKKLDLSKRWNWVEHCSPQSRRGQRLLWIQLKQSHISAPGCARAAANHPPVEQSEGKVNRPCAICISNSMQQPMPINKQCVCVCICNVTVDVFVLILCTFCGILVQYDFQCVCMHLCCVDMIDCACIVMCTFLCFEQRIYTFTMLCM